MDINKKWRHGSNMGSKDNTRTQKKILTVERKPKEIEVLEFWDTNFKIFPTKPCDSSNEYSHFAGGAKLGPERLASLSLLTAPLLWPVQLSDKPG